MKTVQISFLKLTLIVLCFTIGHSQLTLQVSHPIHLHTPKHHSLTTSHRKFVIYHDMRVFKTEHNKNFAHEGVSTQTYNLNEKGYYFTLSLKIADMDYNLNIDTGSSDIFIKGEDSPGNPVCKYRCQSCKDNNNKYTISYLDGSLQTYQTNLTVSIGNHVFDESILVAYSADKNFQNSEGLVGLSFPELARNPYPTFLQTLINNKIIDSYSFGVNLNFQQSKRSFITFGKPDPSHFEGTLKKYKLLYGFSYSIGVKGLTIGSGKFLQLNQAIFDTGNTCISIPEKYQNDVLSQFNKNGNKCSFDVQTFAPQFSLLRCIIKNFDVLPSLTIKINTDNYVIDKDVYMQRCLSVGRLNWCDLYIETVKHNEQLFLGDGFFQRFYTFFDLKSRQVGIAKNKETVSYKFMFKGSDQFDDQDQAFFNKLQQSS